MQRVCTATTSARQKLVWRVIEECLCESRAGLRSLARDGDPQSGSLDDRARGWLEVNCAHCHNPKGSARTSGLDLRTVQTDAGKFGVFKSPVAAGKGSGGRRYDIIPGKPDESILMDRLETEEPGARMPSLARNLIHSESNQLIREWILAMKADAESIRK